MSSQVSTQRSAAGASHVLGERAVVIGASMSGLLTARVLADFFDT